MSLPTGRASLIPSSGPDAPPPGPLATTVADQIADLVARVEALEQGLAGHTHAAPVPVAAEPEVVEEAPVVAEAAEVAEAEAGVTLKNGDVLASVDDLTASNVAKMTKTELIGVCDAFAELGVADAADRSKKELQAAVLEAITSS